MVQKELKEKEFDPITLIGGWYIPEELCDELIDFFNYNKKYQTAGKIADGEDFNVINKNIKDSSDLKISSGNFDTVIGVYREQLQVVLENYKAKYEYANKVCAFNIKENINIQHYPVGGGYKLWHSENRGDNTAAGKRHLVFMTYLNDVEDGGTEFLYQNIKTKAEKGLTLIWPTIWTHTHRGIVSNTKEKTILTGWFSFEI